MASYRRSTIDMVASVLTPSCWLTPREVEKVLPFHLHRNSVRAVLGILVSEQRAVVEGDVSQRRYLGVEVARG